MSRSWWSLAASLALVLTLGLAFWRESSAPWQAWAATYNATAAEPVPTGMQALVPTRTGEPELCVTCHVGVGDISAAHPVEALGCVVCHGGEPLALDAERAHSTMRGGRNPSDLSVAAASCGTEDCHGGYADEEQNHVDRVLKSLQATYAGGIASVRYVLGAQRSPTAEVGLRAEQDSAPVLPDKALRALRPLPSPLLNGKIDAKFQANCLDGGCHLGAAAKQEPYYYRSTGCAACHYAYDDAGLYTGDDPTVPHDQPGHGREHRLTTAIPYTQCNHCHNRGNYSLKQMDFVPRDDLPAPVPSGDRPTEYYQPLATYTLCEVELDCVDCHTGQEVMGDGHIYGSQKDAQYVQCQTCHGTADAAPALATVERDDELAMRRARLAGREGFLAVGDRVVRTERDELLWSIKQQNTGELVQVAKVSGRVYAVPLVKDSECEQDGHTQTSDYCHECHAVAR